MSVGEFWPERGVTSCEWTDQHRQSLPAGLSGNSIAVDYGEPFWRVEFEVSMTSRSLLARQWSGFIRRREGRKNTFTMNRTFQSFPFRGGVAGDVGLTVSAYSRANSTVTLSGVEAGYQPTVGDMISYFTEGQGYYAGEVIAEANVAGGSVTLQVWPAPRPPHATTPSVRRIKAIGEFRVTSAPSPDEAFKSRGFRVTAEQVIR